jgi:hypothetical protein
MVIAFYQTSRLIKLKSYDEKHKAGILISVPYIV